MNLNNLLYIIFFNSWNLNQRQWRQSSACQLAGAMQPDLKAEIPAKIKTNFWNMLCIRVTYSFRNKFFFVLPIGLCLFCFGCTSSDNKENKKRTLNQKGEYIYRKHNEFFCQIPPPEKVIVNDCYSFEDTLNRNHLKITKEHFRCQGRKFHPCKSIKQNEETRNIYDCGGAEKHGLPLRKDQEFIYPILIDLLNYIQDQTNKKVIVTSGHRCPEHNMYVDTSPANGYSKHQIGAEVSFYVEGLENNPERIISLIQQFYQKNSLYQNQPLYREFKRYEKNTESSILPWYNKEVFIKIVPKNEGRNFDNRHTNPYIVIQVRHDKDLNENVTYSFDKAYRCYHRK